MNSIKKSLQYSLVTIAVLSMFAACSSDDTNTSSTTESTPIVVQGAITAKGSIFVNGVEFETDSSSISIDDNPGANDGLKVGMVVTVNGSIDDSGNHGVASTVLFDDEVQGAVSSLVDNGLSKTFSVLGQNVVADITSTVFDNTSYAALGNGDIVEVSGALLSDGTIIATRVEDKGISTKVERKGTVSALSGTTFTLGTINVDATSATMDPTDLVLADGQFVEVEGTFDGTTILATKVQLEDSGFDDNIAKVSLEGAITSFNSNADFILNGQAVDASSATLTPTTLILAERVVVEVEGPIVNGVLQAYKVEGRHEEMKFNAKVTVVGINTLTLSYNPGTITLYLDSSTEVTEVSFGTGLVNQYIFAEGMDVNGKIVLAKLKEGQDDRDIVQGEVSAYSQGSTITVEGLNYTLDGSTQFENNNGVVIAESEFAALYSQPGTLVKVKDRPVDGIADEISIQFED